MQLSCYLTALVALLPAAMASATTQRRVAVPTVTVYRTRTKTAVSKITVHILDPTTIVKVVPTTITAFVTDVVTESLLEGPTVDVTVDFTQSVTNDVTDVFIQTELLPLTVQEVDIDTDTQTITKTKTVPGPTVTVAKSISTSYIDRTVTSVSTSTSTFTEHDLSLVTTTVSSTTTEFATTQTLVDYSVVTATSYSISTTTEFGLSLVTTTVSSTTTEFATTQTQVELSVVTTTFFSISTTTEFGLSLVTTVVTTTSLLTTCPSPSFSTVTTSSTAPSQTPNSPAVSSSAPSSNSYALNFGTTSLYSACVATPTPIVAATTLSNGLITSVTLTASAVSMALPSLPNNNQWGSWGYQSALPFTAAVSSCASSAFDRGIQLGQAALGIYNYNWTQYHMGGWFCQIYEDGPLPIYWEPEANPAQSSINCGYVYQMEGAPSNSFNQPL